LKNDRAVVVAAVKANGRALNIASNELKNDREIVLAAVTQNGYVLEFASNELKNDREIVLAAVTQNGYALEFASGELKNDRAIVLAAVTNGRALEFASDELKNDRAIVLAAVKADVSALEFASDELKNDREFVLAAVKKYGRALQYASHELKHDYAVRIPAVANGLRWWDDKFEVFVQDLLRDSEHFMGVFLMGWGQQFRQKDNTHRQANFNNKLPMLNKLGKYGSIQVKKLIADYAGVYYGERLVTALISHRIIFNKYEKQPL
jgi:hypothetical protein